MKCTCCRRNVTVKGENCPYCGGIIKYRYYSIGIALLSLCFFSLVVSYKLISSFVIGQAAHTTEVGILNAMNILSCIFIPIEVGCLLGLIELLFKKNPSRGFIHHNRMTITKVFQVSAIAGVVLAFTITALQVVRAMSDSGVLWWQYSGFGLLSLVVLITSSSKVKHFKHASV